jgi:hypothetical protein
VLAVLVAGVILVGAVGVFLQRSDHTTDGAASGVSLTKEISVERGDLTVSESVDGSLEETDTLTVIHRTEGGTGIASTSSAGATGGTGGTSPTQGSTPAGPASGLSATAVVAAESYSFSLTLGVPPTPTTPATTAPPDTAAPTTTVDPSAPPTTVDATTPTTPATTVPRSAPTGGNGPGGLPTGGATTGGAAVGGAASTGSTGTTAHTMTGIAEVGDEIGSGDILYTIEGNPVVALSGALPAWRTMDSSSDDGADIAQLEAALVAIGYDPDGTVVVDEAWDADTTAMVRRWQSGLHVADTGKVTLGSVVFIAHAGTVVTTSVGVGGQVEDGTTILTMSGTMQQVIIEVPAELQATVVPSMVVDIAGTPGKVQRLRSADGTEGVTVQAVISPDAPIDSPAGSTVRVTIASTVAADQLLVATEAIVSRLDGTYAVEVPGATGGHSFVPVQVVAVSGNRTAITGDGVTEAMTVLAPA